MTRIMIVEDERIVALNLEDQLTKLGYEVCARAVSGEQALRKAAETRPDLVLMDIHLEGELNGIETTARMRRAQRVPVVYLTAHSEESTLKRARETQPYGYLVKPFSERDLHATIQMALERHQAELALLESEERLRLALDAASMGMWEIDSATHRMHRGEHSDRILGLNSATFDGSWEAFLAHVHPQDRERAGTLLQHFAEDSAPFTAELRSLQTGGAVRWLKLQAKRCALPNGDRVRMIGVVEDVTERREAEEQLRQAAIVFDSTTEGIFVLDRQRKVAAVNQAFTQITGYTASEVMGRTLPLLDAMSDMLDTQDIWSALNSDGRWRGEIRAKRKDGADFPVWLNFSAVRGAQGAIVRYVCVFADVTTLREAEKRLHFLAHYDPLTKLPNRILIMDRIDQVLARARRHRALAALLFIDLDHFKGVNDTLGHEAGDDLLRTVAGRLQAGLRAEDTVGRMGGDEFVVVLDRVDRAEDVAAVVKKLLTLLSHPIAAAGRELSASASVGISMFPMDGESRADLIRAADAAMYAAKIGGRNTYRFYTPAVTVTTSQSFALEQDLRRGVANDELLVRYQPEVAIESNRIVRLEALLHWQHPQRGLLDASEILPVAEQSGLIEEVGAQLLRRACQQTQDWQRAGLQPLPVAVTASARQMRSGHFPELVADILARTQLSPSLLEIELNEHFLQQEDVCVPVLTKLKALGVTLVIDDFGAGYFSFNSLSRLPIQRCKINRAFVRGVPDNTHDAAITAAIIDLGHRLRLSVTAEGVENAEQVEFLRAQGCDHAQGSWYGFPTTPAAIANLLARSPATAQPGVV